MCTRCVAFALPGARARSAVLALVGALLRRPLPPMGDALAADDALAAVSEVASTLSSCYGPLPKEKLLVSATRRVLITSSGAAVVGALSSVEGSSSLHGRPASDVTETKVVALPL